MIDKGLIGHAGALEKAFKEVEFLEEHALEKIQQSRANAREQK